MLRERIARDAVGLAVVKVSPGAVRWHTLGTQRQGGSAAVTRDTLFEWGSLTKSFVALLLADAVLERRVGLEDPVETGLPDGLQLRDANGQPIRLIDLATHRSGLPRMPSNLSAKEMGNPYHYYTESRLNAFLREWKPTVPRDSRFEYSNLGYGLLALVLARRANTSLDALMAERVFKPLGIKDVQFRRPLPQVDDLSAVGAALGASVALTPRLATGHDDERRPTTPWHFDALAGAIGLVGPIEGLGRYLEAALGRFDHSLKPAFAMCLRQYTEGEHPLHPFGLAWEMSMVVRPTQTRLIFNQDGATSGFSSSMWIEPGRGRGAAVLCNSFVETRSLAMKALDPELTNEQFNRVLLPESALKPLTGRFGLGSRLVLELHLRDDKLWALGPRRPEFELVPYSTKRFFSRESGLEILFDPERPYVLILQEGDQRVQLSRL